MKDLIQEKDLIDFKQLSPEEIKEKLHSTIFNIDIEYYGTDQYHHISQAIKAVKNIDNELLINKKNILENLEESYKKSENIDIFLTEKHMLNFFGFLDYLCENNIKMKMSFSKNVDEDQSTDIEGYFENEFLKFQFTCHELGLLSWYHNDPKTTPLKFNNFDKDIEKIKKFFISDMQISDFDNILKKYKIIKDKKILSENKQTIKQKPKKRL